MFHLVDVFICRNLITHLYQNITTELVVLTLIASAPVSDEAQPLSIVESGHDPFDLWRNQ